MNIEGRICRLRALEPDDLDAMYGWENDTDIWRVSGTTAPFSRHSLSRLIDEQCFDIYATRQMRLVIEAKAQTGRNDVGATDAVAAKQLSAGMVAVGAVDLFEFDPQNLRVGLGIIVAPEYRRMGYAGEALALVECYARQTLHLYQLWCSVTADNSASQALFAAAGFSECGVRRDWILTPNGWVDEILMQKIL